MHPYVHHALNVAKAGYKAYQGYKHYSKKRKTTKEGEKTLVGDDTHSGIHRAVIRYSLGHKQHATCIGSYIKYMQDHTFLLTSNSGNTLFTDLFTIGALSQWETSTGSTYGAYNNYAALLALNPGEKITGSAVYTAGQTPAADRMFLHSCTTNLDITNLSTFGAYCRLHIYVAKRDTNLTPGAAYSAIANSSALGVAGISQNGPTIANSTFGAQIGFPTASTGAGGATGAILVPTVPGLEFAAYTDFKKLYKSLHTHTFELSAGAVERIRVDGSINIKHVQSAEDVVNSIYPKGTVFFTMEQLGAVGHVTPAVAGTAPVTHASCVLGVVAINSMKVRPMSAGTTRLEVATIANWESGGAVNRNILNTDAAGPQVVA